MSSDNIVQKVHKVNNKTSSNALVNSSLPKVTFKCNHMKPVISRCV